MSSLNLAVLEAHRLGQQRDYSALHGVAKTLRLGGISTVAASLAGSAQELHSNCKKRSQTTPGFLDAAIKQPRCTLSLSSVSSLVLTSHPTAYTMPQSPPAPNLTQAATQLQAGAAGPLNIISKQDSLLSSGTTGIPWGDASHNIPTYESCSVTWGTNRRYPPRSLGSRVDVGPKIVPGASARMYLSNTGRHVIALFDVIQAWGLGDKKSAEILDRISRRYLQLGRCCEGMAFRAQTNEKEPFMVMAFAEDAVKILELYRGKSQGDTQKEQGGLIEISLQDLRELATGDDLWVTASTGTNAPRLLLSTLTPQVPAYLIPVALAGHNGMHPMSSAHPN